MTQPLSAEEPFVPHWSKKAVWYQIFPERFRNGDPTNDPRVEDSVGSWPHDQKSPWEVHPWTSDWFALAPYEKKNRGWLYVRQSTIEAVAEQVQNPERLEKVVDGKMSPTRLRETLEGLGFSLAEVKLIMEHSEPVKNIWYDLERRRYGGDLQGILDKLDYLEDLGVTALYLNPVFEAPSSHKYDAVSYHHIDPNFGPDPDGDRRLIAQEIPDDPSTWVWTRADQLFLKLIQEVHRRDMRIIIDGVFNHMGLRNPFFLDVLKKQEKSPYADWFIIESWANPAEGIPFDYQGWLGVKELPEWREVEGNIVAGPKRYIFDATRRWMDPDGDGDPSDGIDGWRLDVAFCVGHPFWKDWSRQVKSIRPDAYMTAEVIDTVEANRAYLEGDEFTAVMNYNFAFTSSEFFVEGRLDATEFDRLLKELRAAYPAEFAYALQNLIDSHDTPRVASMIVNGDRFNYRDWGNYADQTRSTNSEFDTRKPTEEEVEVQKLLALFQMTYVGAPMIYYGDEVGIWGANDPGCRKPMLWGDYSYQPEAIQADGSRRQTPDPVSIDRELLHHYRQLIRIRKQNPALLLGSFKTLVTEGQLYGFERRHPGAPTVTVLLNNGTTASTVSIERPPGSYRCQLHQRLYSCAEGQLEVELQPLEGAILIRSGG